MVFLVSCQLYMFNWSPRYTTKPFATGLSTVQDCGSKKEVTESWTDIGC